MSDKPTSENEVTKRKLGIRIFSYCVNKLWLLLASIIILIALIHVSLGVLLPKIDYYQSDIIEWVENEYQVNIEVEKLSAEWSVYGPTLELFDIRIKSADESYDVLRIDHVSLYLDIVSSVKNKKISTEEIAIEKAEINFYLSHDLGVTLSQEENYSSPIKIDNTTQNLFDMLFVQKKISLNDSNLTLYTLSGTAFKYHVETLQVKKFDDIHQLVGQLSYSDGGVINLVSEIYGAPTSENARTEVYLTGSNIHIANLPWSQRISNIKPTSGELSWQFWGTWQDKHWNNINASMNLKNASWHNDKQELNQRPDTVKNDLSSMFSWQHKNINEGYLAIHDFNVTGSDGVKQPLSDFYAKFQRHNLEEPMWELSANHFQIFPLVNYWASLLDVESSLSDFLVKAKPSLNIDLLDVKIAKQSDYWLFPEVYLSFSDVKYESWNDIPRFVGISGQTFFSKERGIARLNGDDVELELDDLFRDSINLDSLNSQISWKKNNEDVFDFYVDDFSGINQDLTLQARAAFYYQDKEPILSLYAELTNVDASKKSHYLPAGIMTKDLVSYLDDGVKSGHLPLIKTISRGSLQNFPYHDNTGVFAALGFLENASYKYLPGWPEATELDAKLLFEGNGMDISSKHGKSLSNQIVAASAVVKDLSLDNPILDLRLNVDSKNNSGKNFIKNTPLDFIYDVLEEIDYQGSLNTQVDMEVGLSNEKVKLSGEVFLDDEKSKLTTSVIALDDVKGSVKFTEAGLVTSNVKVSYQGETLDVKLTGKKNKDSPELSLDVRGKILDKGISSFIGDEWLHYMDGKTSFSSLIQFFPVDKPDAVRVLFQSDLTGLEFKLPEVLGKKKEDVSELFMTLDLDDESTGEIKWKELSGRWFWKNEGVKSNTDFSGIELGGDFFLNKKALYPDTISPGFRVQASFEHANHNQWHQFILSLNKQFSKSNNNGYDLSDDIDVELIDVNVMDLKTKITDLSKVNIKIKKPKNDVWSMTLNSEQGDASMIMNDDSPWIIKAVDLNIKFTDEFLTSVQEDEVDSSNKGKDNMILPTDFIDLDIECKKCIIQEREYGELLAQIRTNDKGIDFLSNIKHSKNHNLLLSGSWELTEASNSKTQIQFELKTDDVGDFLRRWDIDAAIEDSSVLLIADINWQDAPWNFDYTSFEGDMQLSLGKGYLSEISEGGGRLLTLFNLQSILRKLTFDFKDVYKKGFFYDSISGTFQIREGILSTENVEIKGNVADVKLYGTTDIANRNVEQLAIITPHLTSSFPVLAAWAVEPTTGIIVYLLGKLMEPAVEVATQIDYRIYGSFDDVKVDEIKKSKQKIKVEYEADAIPEEIRKSLPKENKIEELPKEAPEDQSEQDQSELVQLTQYKPAKDKNVESDADKILQDHLTLDNPFKLLRASF